MKLFDFSRTNNLRICFIVVCALVFLGLPTNGADNRYVSVTSINSTISLCSDGMTFHVSPNSRVTIVSVSAKPPFRLLRPNPPGGVAYLSDNTSTSWAVECEDKEKGGVFGAWGVISKCPFPFLEKKDIHVDHPNLQLDKCLASFVDSSRPEGGILIDYKAHYEGPGAHKILRRYGKCPECGSEPPTETAEYYNTTFDEYKVFVTYMGRQRELGSSLEQCMRIYFSPSSHPIPAKEITFLVKGINSKGCCTVIIQKTIPIT